MSKQKEAATAEFFSTSSTNVNQLKVKFNNKVFTWEQFLKLVQIDSGAQEVLAIIERERRKDQFQGDLAQYILKKYRYYSAPNDVTIKDAPGGKKLVDIDSDEMSRVESDPVIQRKATFI
jgi:hypothetical protein